MSDLIFKFLLIFLVSHELKADGISLQEAIQTAFKKNPITQANDLRLDAARDRARGARLDMYPSGSLSYSHGINQYRSHNNDISSYGNSDYGGWNVGVHINLYHGGADLNRAKAAEKDVEALEATNNSTNALIPDTKGSLANDVYGTYLSIVINKLQVEFFASQRQFLEIILKAANSSDDKNQIEAAISSVDNTLLTLRKNTQKSKKAYEYYVKMPAPSKMNSLDEIATSLQIPEVTSDAIAIAELHSPEIKIVTASLESARLNHKALKAESFSPRVDLSVNRGYSYFNESDISSRNLSTTAQLTVSVPFGASQWAYSSASRKEVEAKEQDLMKVLDRMRFVLEDELYVSLDNYQLLTERYFEALTKISSDMSDIIEKVENNQPIDIDYALSTMGNQSSQFSLYIHNYGAFIDTKFSIQKTIGTLF